ncbi:hypothetical protein VP1G_10565 [Cytospora mali]|uniref:Zn(2)-C6 fungal-type domain-containing protein n=1 Tax=Cytospora mali TaxID=578113 RepID=A0A194UPU9_CYTMA|nr:hypothetical protein VP1G_10565 [Valsa mali var. pyri (nom. inval.)]
MSEAWNPVPQHGSKTKRQRGTLDRFKCEDCRRRKVKCAPQGRNWPDKCDQCRRMDLPCSQPRVADRTRRDRTRTARHATLLAHVPVPVLPEQFGDTIAPDQPIDPALDVQETHIDYQALRDIVVLLRLHVLEVTVHNLQEAYLSGLLAEMRVNPALRGRISPARHSEHEMAVKKLRGGLIRHVSKVLESPQMPLSERTVLCQLLTDVTLTSNTIMLPGLSMGVEDWQPFDEEGYKYHLKKNIKALRESGDIGGAILLLHSFLVNDYVEGNAEFSCDYSNMLLNLSADITQ